MITIDKKVVTVNETYRVENMTMQKANNVWTASITVGVYDENNTRVDEIVDTITSDLWNAFWASFNSGTYLYQRFATDQNLAVTVHDSESDFVNA